MLDWILQPWPWWFSGILIGLTVPALFYFTAKPFGISGSFQQIGAICSFRRGPEYLSGCDWKVGFWSLVFVIGIGLGGFIAANLLSAEPVEMLPAQFHSPVGALRLFVGGVLIGFGSRYAGGCTSGHAITGISNLNWPSLVATVFFFVGGLAVTWLIGSMIFGSNA